jgi:hypothetical protein
MDSNIKALCAAQMAARGDKLKFFARKASKKTKNI